MLFAAFLKKSLTDKLVLLDHIKSGKAKVLPRLPASSAQGIVGAGPPQAAIGRLSGGTPAKPGFLRSKKCAQNMKKKTTQAINN
jgi:hypothetical protein